MIDSISIWSFLYIWNHDFMYFVTGGVQISNGITHASVFKSITKTCRNIVWNQQRHHWNIPWYTISTWLHCKVQFVFQITSVLWIPLEYMHPFGFIWQFAASSYQINASKDLKMDMKKHFQTYNFCLMLAWMIVEAWLWKLLDSWEIIFYQNKLTFLSNILLCIYQIFHVP